MPQPPVLPVTDSPQRPALDLFKISIAKRLSDALPLTLGEALAGVGCGKKGGDFTVPLPCYRLPGQVEELAANVIQGFQPDEWIESIVFDKPSLHFRVNTTSMICRVLNQVDALSNSTSFVRSEYGSNDSGKGKTIVIEHSSPNIVEGFHFEHLRGTVIGGFLANLYKFCGWKVVSMNYLGDWGTQIGMVAVGSRKCSSHEKSEKNALMHLYNVYANVRKDCQKDPKLKADAREWFKRMEEGDEEVLKEWRGYRALSVKKYQEAYSQLNIEFDVYTCESSFRKDSVEKVIAQLERMGLISHREEALQVDLNKWGLKKPIVRKTDGTSTYITRDIAGAIEWFEQYKFDKMIYVIGSEHLPIAQLFKVLELMGFPWSKSLLRIGYQKVHTPKGKAFLEQIIKEAGLAIQKQMQAKGAKNKAQRQTKKTTKREGKYTAIKDPDETSLEIGITGLKIQGLAARRNNTYPFKWDRLLSFKGDTGPYLQYAHVRLASIGRQNPHLFPLPPAVQIATHVLAQYPHARHIAFLLGTYPDVVKAALSTDQPSGVVTFVFQLARAISVAWNSVVVKGEEDLEKARAKMFLYECARSVLAAAMHLLTIRPLEQM